MDDRIWTLIWVCVLFYIAFRIDEAAVRYKEPPDQKGSFGKTLLGFILYPIIRLGLALLSGGITLLLWGIVAPVFGWPPIDLITAIAITWLVSTVFQGLYTERVKVVGGVNISSWSRNPSKPVEPRRH